MWTRLLAVAVVLASGGGAWGDYVKDREEAVKLVRAGKTQEAMAAFLKMLETAGTDVQKADALEQAASCAARLKQVDRALALADRIPLQAVAKTVRMELLMAARRWKQVIEAFKDEDIGAWPDTVAGRAWYVRGRCFYYAKDGPRAASDLAKAAHYLTEDNAKGVALNALGDTCQHLLADDDKAVAAYRRCCKTRNIYKRAYAAMAIARIYTKRKQYDAAMAELEKLPLKDFKNAHWRALMLAAHSSVLGARGERAEAVARLRQAIEVKGIPASLKKTFEERLETLLAGAK